MQEGEMRMEVAGSQSVGRSVGAQSTTVRLTEQADGRTDREEDGLQLTFDLHFGHASHVSLGVEGVAGVLARWLNAHCSQR